MAHFFTRLPVSGVLFTLSLALAAGCGDGGGSAGSTGSGGQGSGGQGGGGPNIVDISIAFEARVGNEVFDCEKSYTGLGTAGTDVSLTDFRLYVHDVRLIRDDGTPVPLELEQDGLFQHENLVLLDFENKAGACANGTTETNVTIRGRASDVTYQGISFIVGVPFDLNHADVATAPSPLNLSAMFWNWNGGHKFFRVDALPAVGGTSFNMHLGSTGCKEDAMGMVTACDQPNRPEVRLSGFDPSAAKIVIDYAALVEKNDLSQDAGGAPGCQSGMGDPECPAIFGALGIHVDDGSIHPDEQTVFGTE